MKFKNFLSEDQQKITAAVDDAMEAFWASVANSFPEAKTGDLDPGVDTHFSAAADKAVKAWVNSNT